MASELTTSRLQWHAGLGAAPASTAEPSISECLSQPALLAQLDGALHDFVGALGDLNHELNGPAPSDQVGRANDIPRAAAYAVAEVTRMVRELSDQQGAPGDAAWQIETAWLAVLAGDIDNVREHVAEERSHL